ncbi:MAG TPA: aminotransferase class IV [Candidatus Margulisiibacteriota bacterium]|nr:aminotransferase class IV [Candidatus Margulisiibacteriota bacterium]
MSTHVAPFVQINGRIVSAQRAQISVFDRGLLYGDGLFETLRAYRGRPFLLPEHLARLHASADFLGLPVPQRPWRRDIEALLKRNRLVATDAWVRITITRGTGVHGLMPPRRPRPTAIVMAGGLDPAIARAQRWGARVALLPFARHGFLAEHKVLSYLPGVLGKVMAARHEAFEGLFVNADGYITEGTTTNVFAWRGQRLVTPPVEGLLAGITRRTIIELAVGDGLRVVEHPVTPEDLLDAGEAFLTSSLAEVVAITAVDARPIGDGSVGPRTRRLHDLYRQTVDQASAKRRLD